MWQPTFVCACGALMPDRESSALACPRCGRRIVEDRGVFRCLAPDRHERIAPFLSQYRRVRQLDGYRMQGTDYYRALPDASGDDPQASVWEIRRRSFHRLSRELLDRCPGRGANVLDLGAGCGWLSNRLAKIGCRPVAVDLLADEKDGLGASECYETRFPCVQADFDCLPFAPGQFDVVIFNGSLHYSPNVTHTLQHASGMLRAGGLLMITDSPMFTRQADGWLMRRRLRERLRRDYDVESPIEPGEGFLTFGRLAAWAAATGRSYWFFSSMNDWPARLYRFAVARAFGRPDTACFGVWLAA